MPSTKRPLLGDDSEIAHHHNKQQRLDTANHIGGDPQNSNRRKGSSSTRTGQACLRCRTRKIRCDNRPGGCSPCVQNNTECQTTDRITGRATSRGHTENLENENVGLKRYLEELQEQLRAAGVEPKPPPAISLSHGQTETKAEGAAWTAPRTNDSATPNTRSTPERQSSVHALLPGFRAGCFGDNYLGVSFDDWLSPVQGTSLSLFGTKIDLAEFMPSEEEPLTKAMSYQEFLSNSFGRTQKPNPPQLPDFQTCKVYAEWYFRSIQMFIPALHKPDYMQLLARMSDAQYEPTAAETVMIHMVLAITYFQFAARNGGDVNRRAFIQHYHYAISFVPDLLERHELEDIQALTMICSQLRAQPRSAAAWMFTNMVIGLAIESGLHRSAKAWKDFGLKQSPHRLEMRKRVFWTLLRIHVQISGKLGRPMPLRLEDFDIEIPEPMHDNLTEETDLSMWQKCSFRVGIEGFKLCKIILQIFSTIYTLRSAGQYEKSVQTFEQDLQVYEEQLPPELQGGNQSQMVDRVCARFLGMEVAQCQLLLHHPALCPSQSHQLLAHSLDVCLLWSKRLLSHALTIASLKSLDTSLFFTTDFLAAIFTTLFATHERRHSATNESLQLLRADMDQWLNVMSDVGKLLGTGNRLRQAMQNIIDASLDKIGQSLASDSASSEVEEIVAVDEKPRVNELQHFNESNVYSNMLPADEAGGHSRGGPAAPSYHEHSRSQQIATPSDFPGTSQYTFANTQVNGMPSYGAFDSVSYAANGSSKSAIGAQMEAQMASMQQHQSSIPPDYITSFQTQSNGVTSGDSAFPHSAAVPHELHSQQYRHSFPAAWRQFTGSVMGSVSNNLINGHGYLNGAAAALMPQPVDDSMGLAAAHVAAMNGLQMPHGDSSAQLWPLIQFHDGPGDR